MNRKSAVAAFAFVLLIAPLASAQSGVDQGKKVYADQKCSICHSVAGVGNKKEPVDKVGAKLSATEIRSWITESGEMAAKAKSERKPVMKPYNTLAPADVD